MSSEKFEIEPHVLAFMRQMEEPNEELARRPIDPERPTPKLRRITRKLSDPAHKTVVPVKPILKSVETMPESYVPEHSRPAVKSNVPLKFTSRKVPQSDKSSSSEALSGSNSSSDSESSDDLFFTPPEDPEDPWGNGDISRDGTDNYYVDPPTPLPTPMLRISFSQDSTYQGYPSTPRNTIRVKRRPPPIVDELDRQQRISHFPSRQSFTFSPPLGSPSLNNFPRPCQTPTDENKPSSAAPTVKADADSATALVPARKTSWLASLPSFTNRSTEKHFSMIPGNVRDASKRKSGDIDADIEPKRRRVVRLELPSEHKPQHPPMTRRPTPYYEPFSAKVKRVALSLFTRSQVDEGQKAQSKAQLKAEKLAKKREKRARKELEELKDSFRHFDDLVD